MSENKHLIAIGACVTSAQMVPYYATLIWETIGKADLNQQVVEVNQHILGRFKKSTLISIKNKAWKLYELRVASVRKALALEVQP